MYFYLLFMAFEIFFVLNCSMCIACIIVTCPNMQFKAKLKNYEMSYHTKQEYRSNEKNYCS